MQNLEIHELNPAQPVQWSIICLHGLGANYQDFLEPQGLPFGIAQNAPVRFILPNAPLRSVTCTGGYTVRAWFDLLRYGTQIEANNQEITIATGWIQQLIERECARGVARNHILVAGFSQGGVLALNIALKTEPTIAGAIVLSGWLPQELYPLSLKTKTAIFMGHGTLDDVVPFAQARQSADYLIAQGVSLTFRQYIMPHATCYTERADLQQWLKKLADWNW